MSAACRAPAEVNSRGFKRLASKLTHVQPEVRQELIELAAGMSEKSSPLATRAAPELSRLAVRRDEEEPRGTGVLFPLSLWERGMG